MTILLFQFQIQRMILIIIRIVLIMQVLVDKIHQNYGIRNTNDETHTDEPNLSTRNSKVRAPPFLELTSTVPDIDEEHLLFESKSVV